MDHWRRKVNGPLVLVNAALNTSTKPTTKQGNTGDICPLFLCIKEESGGLQTNTWFSKAVLGQREVMSANMLTRKRKRELENEGQRFVVEQSRIEAEVVFEQWLRSRHEDELAGIVGVSLVKEASAFDGCTECGIKKWPHSRQYHSRAPAGGARSAPGCAKATCVACVEQGSTERISSAVRNGHVKCVAYALATGEKWTPENVELLLKTHGAECKPWSKCVERAIASGCRLSDKALLYLAQSGAAHLLRKALPENESGKRAPELFSDLCRAAARSDNVEYLESVHEFVVSCGKQPWSHFSVWDCCCEKSRSTACLAFALHHGAFPSGALDCAAANGLPKHMKLLIEKGAACTPTTLLRAAESGNVQCMELARESGQAPWTEEVCLVLASRGNLDALVFARQNGCPWHDETCEAIVENGRHVSCLRYALENECPRNAKTLSYLAAQHATTDLLCYVAENQLLDFRAAVKGATEGTSVACLAYLFCFTLHERDRAEAFVQTTSAYAYGKELNTLTSEGSLYKSFLRYLLSKTPVPAKT